MRKTYKGVVYDTDTAECVAEWDNGLTYGDFNYQGAELWRTPTGEWFSTYSEGPAQNISGYWVEEELSPVTPKKAKWLLTVHKETEALERFFPRISEHQGEA
jgi:hypothetical protein